MLHCYLIFLLLLLLLLFDLESKVSRWLYKNLFSGYEFWLFFKNVDLLLEVDYGYFFWIKITVFCGVVFLISGLYIYNVLLQTPTHGHTSVGYLQRLVMHQLSADTGYNLAGTMDGWRDGWWESLGSLCCQRDLMMMMMMIYVNIYSDRYLFYNCYSLGKERKKK